MQIHLTDSHDASLQALLSGYLASDTIGLSPLKENYPHAVRPLVNGASAPLGRELSPFIDKSQGPSQKSYGVRAAIRTVIHPTQLLGVDTRISAPIYPRGSQIRVTSRSGNMAEVSPDEDVRSQKRDRSEFEGEGKYSSEKRLSSLQMD